MLVYFIINIWVMFNNFDLELEKYYKYRLLFFSRGNITPL